MPIAALEMNPEMIVLELACEHEHRFEGWFASASAFETQRTDGLLSCPVCGSRAVERRPSAPHVVTRSGAAAAPQRAAEPVVKHAANAPARDAMAALFAQLRELARGSEDVGERFAEEARRIHYGETETRSIRGRASHTEMHELLDEGVMVLPLPPADEDMH